MSRRMYCQEVIPGGGGVRNGKGEGQPPGLAVLSQMPGVYPPPPVPKNHLAQEPTPGSAVKFSHHFFYQGSGFFMFLVDVGQLFRCAGHHFMCVTMGPPIRGDPISHSQAHVCFCTTSSIPCSVPQTFPCTLPVSLSSIGDLIALLMMQSPCILMSQTPSLSLSRSQLQRRV